MLTAGAPTDQGPLLFIGFDPADLAHLRANQPLRVDGVQHGLPDVPLVLLFETDPMVTFWAAQTWAVVVLVRESTIAAMRAAADGFVAVSLEHPLLPAGTLHLPSDLAVAAIEAVAAPPGPPASAAGKRRMLQCQP